MTTEWTGNFFPEARNPASTIVINERCQIGTQHDNRAVTDGIHDSMSEALAMVNLVEQGWADQSDVVRAFGRSVGTVPRYQQRFEEGGKTVRIFPECCPAEIGRLPTLIGALSERGVSLRVSL